jgi:hypothetical protein
MDINITFCRHLLANVSADVRAHFLLKYFDAGRDHGKLDHRPYKKPMQDAWVYKVGRDHWEFHGPDDYYWHGGACNAYEARYKGWCAWLRKEGAEGYSL